MNTSILILALIGLLVSIYTLHIKQHLQHNKNYKPFCDINSIVSCSKAIKTKYGTTFRIPNAIFGIIGYTIIIMFSILELNYFIFVAATISLGASLYLAYISYFRLKVICPVCHTIYLVSILMFIVSYP